MERLGKSGRNDVIAAMFVPAAAAMIFTTVAGFLATTIDGLITSNYLGRDAYSAVSLFAPMVNIILLFAYFIAVGGQVLCSMKVGAGEKDDANAVFSFSVTIGAGFSVFFLLLGFLAPDVIFAVCGASKAARPQLHAYMAEYLNGYLYGIPALIMVQVLSPFLIMDNGKRLISVSAAMLCVTDVAGDLLNVLVFHGGVFGMGMATSVSFLAQLLVLLLHFLRKDGYFRFSLKGFHLSYLKSISKNGALTLLRSLATILRDLFTNHLNLAVAVGMAAVAAKGIQNDLNTLMFCLGIGIGKVLLPMTSMYYGADDRNGIKRLFACSMKTCILYAGGTGAVLFVTAPLIARIYTGDPEVASLAVFGVRCMAAGLVLDTLSVAFQSYLQGIQRLKLVNFLCFAERFFIPVAVSWVLGTLFGSKGVIASIAASKLVLFLLMMVTVCIHRKGLPRQTEDYMFLPEGFGVEEGSELFFPITTPEEVVRQSEAARQFCLAHGTDAKKANLMALFVEEMAGNIVRHGNPRGRNGICVDFRLYTKDNRICITLRDYCDAFDPTKYYEIHKEDPATQNIGIRLVMKLARDIRYMNSFNSNCTMILLE